MNTIAKNLRYLRLLAGVKQEVVAQYLDIEQQAYSKFENNRIPKVEHLQKLARFYKVTIEDITQKHLMEQKNPYLGTVHQEASTQPRLTQDERDLFQHIISAQHELINRYERILKLK